MRKAILAAVAMVLAGAAGPSSMSADEAYARAVTYFETRFNQMAAADAERNALRLAEAQSLKAQLADARTQLAALKAEAEKSQSAQATLQAFAEGSPGAALDAIEARAKGASASALAEWKRLGALAFPVDTARAITAYRETLKLAPDDVEAATRLAALYLRQGRGGEAGELAAGLIESPDAAIRIQGLLLAGDTLRLRGQVLGAEGRYREAWSAAKEAKLADLEADAAARLGQAAFDRNQFPSAEGFFKEALAGHRAAKNESATAASLLGLGAVFAARKAPAAAEGAQREALAIYESLGDQAGEAAALAALGETARLRGDFLLAEGYFRRALKIARMLEARAMQAQALARIGLSAEARKAAMDACLALREAQGLYMQIGAFTGPDAESVKAALERSCKA